MLNIPDKELAKLLATTPQNLQKMKNDEFGSGRIIYSLLSSFTKTELEDKITTFKKLGLVPSYSYQELREKAEQSGYKLNEKYETTINGKKKNISFEFVKEEDQEIRLVKFSKKLSQKDLIDMFFITEPSFSKITQKIKITIVLNAKRDSRKFGKLLNLNMESIEVVYFDEFYKQLT